MGSFEYTSQRAILLALVVNTAFLCIELAAAIYSGSLTLLADAVHMFTDSISLVLALSAGYLALKIPDEKRTYGYQRLEVLGGLINGVLLIATVGYILIESYNRFSSPQEVDALVLLGVGGIGLIANLVAARLLHSHQEGSLNVRGAYLHLIADAFGSIGAIIAGIAIYYTGEYFIDVLMALMIAAIVLYSVIGLLKNCVNVLLQGTPEELTVAEISEEIQSIQGVEDVHHIHLWSLDHDSSAASAHVVISDPEKHTPILHESISRLENMGVDHPTVQIERKDFSDSEHDCYRTN